MPTSHATVLTICAYDMFTTAFCLFSRKQKKKQKVDTGHNISYYTYCTMMWHSVATFSYSPIVAVELKYLTVFHTLSGDSSRGRVHPVCHSNPTKHLCLCEQTSLHICSLCGLYKSGNLVTEDTWAHLVCHISRFSFIVCLSLFLADRCLSPRLMPQP